MHGKLRGAVLERRVRRIGGSLAVVIPRDLAEYLGLVEGSPVAISIDGASMVVSPRSDACGAHLAVCARPRARRAR
jgi:antitoxin component of MazEF toxin-antitoxin module